MTDDVATRGLLHRHLRGANPSPLKSSHSPNLGHVDNPGRKWKSSPGWRWALSQSFSGAELLVTIEHLGVIVDHSLPFTVVRAENGNIFTASRCPI